MSKFTFLITYQVFNAQGKVEKSGQMRCKNRFNEFDAKVNLEKHLKANVPNFHSLVISECKLDIDPKAAEKFFDLLKDKDNGNDWFDQFLKRTIGGKGDKKDFFDGLF